jgi:NADH-quinone oxidoreductase subunit G
VAETRDNVVVRLKPRANDQVNQYYLCEVGRQGYREFNRRDRIDQPLVRRGSALAIAEWDDAVQSAARALAGRRLVVLASANLSNEALFLLERTVDAAGGAAVFRLEHGDEAVLPGAPDLALRHERAANATAARLLGFTETDAIGNTLRDGDALLVVGDDLRGVSADDLDRASSIVFVGTALPATLEARAAVVLPITNILEEEGTMTNLRGRVQRFLQAKAAPGVARPTWYVLADLLTAVGGNGRFYLPVEVFAALTSTHASFAGLDYEALGLRGLPIVDHATPADEVTA